ncbi:MAG: hypothetical protein ACFCU7_04980 [Pleurocapsa sp.]
MIILMIARSLFVGTVYHVKLIVRSMRCAKIDYERGFAMSVNRRGERPFAPTGFGGVRTGSIANNRDDVKMIGNCDRLIPIQMQIMLFLVALF